MDTPTPLESEYPVAVLNLDECWSLLRAEEFGRLAFRMADEVHLVPINYLVDGGTLLFRTASGNKLLGAALNTDVAFEIDWHDDDAAWSVVVRGRLRRLEEQELQRLDRMPDRSWVPTLKYDGIELLPEVVTGRTFRLKLPKASS